MELVYLSSECFSTKFWFSNSNPACETDKKQTNPLEGPNRTEKMASEGHKMVGPGSHENDYFTQLSFWIFNWSANDPQRVELIKEKQC